MIDPRFANAGIASLAPGFGAQQVPTFPSQIHHHRHRKNKHAGIGESPMSRDESIHKVDHGNQNFPSQLPVGTGFGVPYTGGATGGFYQTHPYVNGNFGLNNQYQGNYGVNPVAPTGKHHRRHRHQHRGHAEAIGSTAEALQTVPEQLVGRRSGSELNNDIGMTETNSAGGTETSRKSRGRHRHHRSGGHFKFGQQIQNHISVGSDGFGHLNNDLIFIERNENSPQRKAPPSGYEYKGKIEVQGIDREIRSTSRGRVVNLPPPSGPCPPGWQPISLTATPGGPCPPGSLTYTGQVGLGAVGTFGGTVPGLGFPNLATNVPFAPQGQLVADYVVQGSTTGATTQHIGTTIATEVGECEQVEERVSNRATIIEVWQKRQKPIMKEKLDSRSPSPVPQPGPSFDFDKFRDEILGAIERLSAQNTKIKWIGHEGGTQTQISYEPKEKEPAPPSEVRVIVQPIQPVFYMPRQTEPGPAPVVPNIIQAPSAPAQVVYVPRNVYVPVIKPVFVPRERVIVRPQIIHVARPVLVDRPVPVTQRPIIIDRERPVPVPVRSTQVPTEVKTVQEEYVYRDNLPVAYGGRCPEYAGGVNYGYMPTQQEHQYATSSNAEVTTSYQTSGPVVDVTVPNQFESSQSAAQLNVVQRDSNSIHEAYTNLAQTQASSVINGASITCTAPMEVLDATVGPNWQKTDRSSLIQRFGRTAYDIVQKTDEVEQQMYQELRQRYSGAGVQKSSSSASYGSGAGITVNNGGAFVTNNAGVSTFQVGSTENFSTIGASFEGQPSIPVNINY